MKKYKKEIDSIFNGIQDEQTELPQSAEDTIFRLAFSETKPAKKFMWKKWMIAAASAILIIPIAIVLVLRPWIPNDNPNGYAQTLCYVPDMSGLAIALAADKSLDTAKSSKQRNMSFAANMSLNNIDNCATDIGQTAAQTVSFPMASYPFDAIKIFFVEQFMIRSKDNNAKFLEQICDYGDITVMIAEFMAYKYNLGELVPIITGNEKMIIFKGIGGMFCCLLNNAVYDPETYLTFSSHKYFNGLSIEKDKTYPIRTFKVGGGKVEYRLTDYDLNGFTQTTLEKTYTVLNGSYKSVDQSNLYEVAELLLLEQVEIEATVTGIDCSTQKIEIEPMSPNRLNAVLIDENTIIQKAGEKATITDIEEGDTIKIVYIKYYSDYNPKMAIAAGIMIL